jgi:deferrochelatase/peroxidase EfeB
MKPVDVDLADVQGLVRYGYSDLTEACYFVAQIKDPVAARAWLAKQKFTSVADGYSPETALQVAVTFAGLQRLEISKEIREGFPADFRSGMTGEEARSRRLGDVGRNDPTDWLWGGPGKVPHLLIMLFAKSATGLGELKTKIIGQLWSDAFHEPLCLPTSNMGGHEPFGFKDGISQPRPDWERRIPVRLRNTRDYTNQSALGEFLLGYPNEYAQYTDRPLVSRADDPKDILLPAEDAPGRKDFGRNGTYLVMRDLAQDVAGFWKYVDAQTAHDADRRKSLAAAMVGRKLSGDPLVTESLSIPGVKPDSQNGFTFRNDPNGTTCPFGAHIRRANPRMADLPDGTEGPISFLVRMLGFGGSGVRYDLLESARFHRIIRRGREYGPPITPDQALKEEVPPEGGRGLRFICLNGNILRQFEFVQNSWIANPRFNGLEETDPLLGNRESLCSGGSTDTFTRPQESGVNRRCENVPMFVRVRGGAYFFMPGLHTLRYICDR